MLKRFAQGLYAWVTPAIWDLAETGSKFGDRFSVAKGDLKKHIGLDKYKTAQYGIAVSFAFDPVDMLLGRNVSGQRRIL